jgi:hypothetical protein
MSSKDFKYELEKGSKKHHCPACNKKTLVRYVHAGTREYVDEVSGRCDRENNCGYHKTPTSDTPLTPPIKRELPAPKLVLPANSYLEGIKNDRSSEFHRFCMDKLHISKDHLDKWGVGSRWKFTAFMLTNKEQVVVNVKFIAYNPDGKRNKDLKEDGSPKFVPHYLGKSFLKNEKIETETARLEDWQDYYKIGRCFYGEHLWDAHKETCLVESEKSAVIAAWFFPQYNWLATGGNNGMTFEHFNLFFGYKSRIHYLTDNDPAGFQKSKTIEWLDKLSEARDDRDEIRSINIFSNDPQGYDIADAIIYNEYRDAKVLSRDIDQAYDVRKVVSIDERSGEIIVKDPAVVADEKQLRRARQVGDRIFAGKVDIISETGQLEMAIKALSSFGLKGREIARKALSVSGKYLPEQIEEIFDKVIGSNPGTSPSGFFKLAHSAGVDVRYIKTKRSEAAEGAEEIGMQEYMYNWPAGMEEQKDFDEFAERRQVQKYNFVEWKNCYWYASFSSKENSVTFLPISNFIIKPLYIILSKTDPKRIYEIINVFGRKVVMDVPAKALVSLTEFQVFAESQGNFLFEGNKVQFTRIKRKLYNETADAYEVKMLGWQDEGFYAFGNGSYNGKFTKVDGYGIVKHLLEKNEEEAEERNFFIPAFSEIYKHEKDQYESEKKFIFINRPDVTFKDWTDLFYKCYGDNGILGMSFYLTSLYRDIIYHKFKFFPHLFLFGPPGTGKSTMCWSLQYMFGLERKPFMLNAGTAVGFHRTFAQFRNAVVWFDEYNNTIEFKRVQDLKSAYDGAGHVKGEWSAGGGNSNKTTSTPVESACMISGQELPIADNALFKRCILLQYYQTTFSDQEKDNMTRLQNMQVKGMSHITGAMTRFRDRMVADYFASYDQVEKELSDELMKDPMMESRIIKNMAVVATTLKILMNVQELKFPWTWEKAKQVMMDNIKSQNGLISSAKETNQFWDTIDFLISDGELKDGIDYKIEYKHEINNVMIDRNRCEKRTLNETKRVLFIRLSTAHPKYLERLRKQGDKKGMDKGSLAHYLSHSPGFFGNVKSTSFKNGTHTFANSAYAFDYEMLENAGYNFDRSDPETSEELENAEAVKDWSGKNGKKPDF